MKFNGLALLLLMIPLAGAAETLDFEETFTVYGVIKPAKMTHLIAVNNGMVSKIPFRVGEKIRFGQVALSAIERETTRGYRSTISGRVAKLHVSEGAAVTPGMPLVTIIDPDKKLIEISLSPKEAQSVREGSVVYTLAEPGSNRFGKIQSVSPLVDPDTGGVISYVRPEGAVKALIGDVMPLSIVARKISGCKVVEISEVDRYLDNHLVEATSGNKICLKEKSSIKE